MIPTEEWFQKIIDHDIPGVELVQVELAGGQKQRVVRLYIDHLEGVSHDLCGRVSDTVGRALDDIDAIGGPYTLEVSSPGLERPLRKLGHFQAQLGKNVCVKTRVPIEGTKVWRGTLVEATVDGVLVDDAGKMARIPLDQISSAHLVYEFK
jgi:ribosome maturation factor RimP